MREPDATVVQPDDPEIEADEAQDEFAGGSVTPVSRQVVRAGCTAKALCGAVVDHCSSLTKAQLVVLCLTVLLLCLGSLCLSLAERSGAALE